MATAEGAPASDLEPARSGIRDTAKWVMAASAAVATLVVGSGSFSSLGAMEPGGRLAVAAISALAASICCWLLFSSAVAVLRQRPHVLSEIAVSPEFRDARAAVDAILVREYPPGLQSVEEVNREYTELRNAYFNADATEKSAIRPVLEARLSRVVEVTELCVTEQLSQRFDALMSRLRRLGPITVIAIVIFVWAANPPKDVPTVLSKPFVVQIAWSADQEQALVSSGLARACFANAHPTLVAVAKAEGLRTTVIAYPVSVDAGCGPIKLNLESSGKLSSSS